MGRGRNCDRRRRSSSCKTSASHVAPNWGPKYQRNDDLLGPMCCAAIPMVCGMTLALLVTAVLGAIHCLSAAFEPPDKPCQATRGACTRRGRPRSWRIISAILGVVQAVVVSFNLELVPLYIWSVALYYLREHALPPLRACAATRGRIVRGAAAFLECIVDDSPSVPVYLLRPLGHAAIFILFLLSGFNLEGNGKTPPKNDRGRSNLQSALRKGLLPARVAASTWEQLVGGVYSIELGTGRMARLAALFAGVPTLASQQFGRDRLAWRAPATPYGEAVRLMAPVLELLLRSPLAAAGRGGRRAARHRRRHGGRARRLPRRGGRRPRRRPGR